MNILANALNRILIAWFLLKTLNLKVDDKRKWIRNLAGLIIFNVFINLSFGIESPLGYLFIFLFSTFIYSYLLDVKFMKILTLNILGMILILISMIIVISSMMMVYKVEPSVSWEFSIYGIIALLSSKILFCLMATAIIDRINPIDIIYCNINQFILIGSFNIIIIIMTLNYFLSLKLESRFAHLQLGIMSISSIVFSFLIYIITQKMIEQGQKEILWKMREEEFEKTDFYIKNINDILHTIKTQGHDFNNYISTLYGLMYLEKFEEAKEYIMEIDNRVGNMSNVIETNHPVITALVNVKRKEIFEGNIEMKLDIDLPEVLTFDYVDLSIILGNLLDNAIDACKEVKEDRDKIINLSIYIDNDHLIIKASNTKNESIKLDTENILKRYTSKTDRENHGYGLGNIQCVVEEYEGTMEIEDFGDIFSLNIKMLIEKRMGVLS